MRTSVDVNATTPWSGCVYIPTNLKKVDSDKHPIYQEADYEGENKKEF